VGLVDVQHEPSDKLSWNIETHGPSSSQSFTLHLVSRDTGKPTIAAITDSLLRKATDGDAEVIKISVTDLQAILEGMDKYK